MRKILLLTCLFIASAIMVNAAEIGYGKTFSPQTSQLFKKKNVDPNLPQDSTNWQKYWKLTGVVGLNLTQTSFTNWAAGGQNNANGVVFANLNLAYQKGLHSWEAHLLTELGMMYTMGARPVYAEDGETILKKTNWRKSSDKIDFSTKYGFEFKKTWFVTAMASFKSQYARGFDYAKFDKGDHNKLTYVSNWLSPSYSDFSVGIDWKPKPFISLYLSPVAGRITTCTAPRLKDADDYVMPYTVNGMRQAYGIDTTTGRAFKADFGLTFKAEVNYTYKNLTVMSTLVLFTPYTNKKQPFGNFDVDWDFSISYQFLKVLNVSLMTSLKYYDQVMITDKNGNVGPRVQFKEVLGLGIGYSF